MNIKIKKFFSVLLLITIVLTTLLASSSMVFSAGPYNAYIMGYFKDGATQYGLNLCYSTDGLHWTDLNNGNPVYVPTLGQQGLRDPFVFRKQDGTFGIVATDMRGQNWGDHSQYVHYFDSTDLCTFSNARLLKVHNTSMHSWAPEVFYDAPNSRYGIYWSGNTDYNRTYVNYTTNFSTVTSNQVLFDPGYDAIDADIISNGGTNYLFFKDERSTGKRIKAAKSTSFNPGSFTVFTPNFLTSSNTEGPITFKDNNSNTWYMYADLFAQGGIFECWRTTNLDATSWTKVTDISVPSGVRHGSIVPVTQTELDKIKAKWGNQPVNRIQSYNYQTRYVRHYNYDIRIDANVSPIADSQWKVVPGLASSASGYVSFESVNFPGYYLRHDNYDFVLAQNDGTSGFAGDATFKQVSGLKDSSWSSFQSYNYPTRYIRHYAYYLKLDPISTDTEKQDATFKITN